MDEQRKAGKGSQQSRSPCQAKRGARKQSGGCRGPRVGVRVTGEEAGEPHFTAAGPHRMGWARESGFDPNDIGDLPSWVKAQHELLLSMRVTSGF